MQRSGVQPAREPPARLPRAALRGLAVVVLMVAIVLGAVASAGPVAVSAQTGKPGGDGLAPILGDLAEQAGRLRAAGAPADPAALVGASKRLRDAAAAGRLRLDGAGRVQVDVRLVGEGPEAVALAALGAEVERRRVDLGRAQLRVPVAELAALAAGPGVAFVDLPTYAVSAAGSQVTQGDAALRAALVRGEEGLSGAGVRVGVISDGVGGLAEAQAVGDLPRLAGSQSFHHEGIGMAAGSEGTAMLEIVHDLAPGADLYFANAETDLDMMEAVTYLAERTDIVVDDLGFFFPDDQASAVSRNTAAALNNADWPIRAYITAVGNWARRHYAGPFRAGVDGTSLGLAASGPVHEFRATSETTDFLQRGPLPYQEIFLEADEEVLAVLFWDDPWGASENDYDLYLLDASNALHVAATLGQGVTSANPREILTFTNDQAGGMFRLVVHNFQERAAPRALELFVFRNGALGAGATVGNFNTLTSSMLAQSDAGGGVISAAAVGYAGNEVDEVRPSSSRGPTNNGAMKPDLAGVDGVAVTGSGGFGAPFFGTSAAAAHVAGIAALLLEARPQLLAADGGPPDRERALLRASLVGGSVDFDGAGANNVSGAGRLDAPTALAQLRARVLIVDQGGDAGPGSLRVAIERANAGGAGPVDIRLRPGLAIVLAGPLPALTGSAIRIDGAGATVDGTALAVGSAGLVVRGAGAALAGFTLTGFPGAALRISGAEGVRLEDVTLRDSGMGLLVDGGARDVVMGAGASVGIAALHNAGDGVRVSGRGTREVQVRNSRIGVDGAGEAAGNGGHGVAIGAGARAVVVGAAREATPEMGVAQTADLVHTVRGRVRLNGQPAPTGMVVEILLDGEPAGATVVGVTTVEGEPGFIFTVPGPGTVMRLLVQGLPAGLPIFFEAGAVATVLLDVVTLEAGPGLRLAGGNVIAFNGGNGIRVEDEGSAGNTFRGNALRGNGALDVDLVAAADPASGLTPPDEGDADRGPNGLLNPPEVSAVRFDGGLARVEGRGPPGALIDLYAVEDSLEAVSAASAAGAGGALRYLGSAVGVGGGFRSDPLRLGTTTVLTALATDAAGNTSEFAVNVVLGLGPRVDRVRPGGGSTAGGNAVTIEGAGFGEASGFRAFFGGREATVVSVRAETAVVLTPANDEGAVAVSVRVADGRTFLLRDGFRYLPGQVVELRPGWNNVTWSGGRTRITTALGPIAGRIDRAFRWNVARQSWDSFLPGAPPFLNTLGTLETGQALWLFVTGTTPLQWSQPLP